MKKWKRHTSISICKMPLIKQCRHVFENSSIWLYHAETDKPLIFSRELDRKADISFKCAVIYFHRIRSDN